MSRPARRLLLLALSVKLALLAALALVIADGWVAFGRAPAGDRLTRLQRSPNFRDGAFQNPLPLWNDWAGSITGAFDISPYASPTTPLPVERIESGRFDVPPPSGLRVTWLGHSTMLLEQDGARVLTDPLWSRRASPFSWAGPARWYDPPAKLTELPKIDVVLISHDHYDHLDQQTIAAIATWETTFVVPLGVGAHLAYWGVPEQRIVELDWWEATQVGGLTITATPARHASGRLGPLDQDRTLWAGYALHGPAHRVWYSGDTGFFPGLAQIGAKLGPFDLTMIEAGAYGAAWPDWHLGPEQALQAHQLVQGRAMLATHWGLFNLAYHGWTEPIERALVAAELHGARLLTPRPGQSVEPTQAGAQERWWPSLPWKSAAEAPIVATGPR